MTPKFEACFAITNHEEGGFQKVYTDRGNWTSGKVGVGELKGTKFGLTAMTYSHLDIVNLTIDDVKPIFFEDFYNRLRCEDMPGPLAALVYDSSINNGQDQAAKWLQISCGAKPDGIVGDQTIKAVNAFHGRGALLMTKFQGQRIWGQSHMANWNTNRGWADRLAGVVIAAMQVEV